MDISSTGRRPKPRQHAEDRPEEELHDSPRDRESERVLRRKGRVAARKLLHQIRQHRDHDAETDHVQQRSSEDEDRCSLPRADFRLCDARLGIPDDFGHQSLPYRSERKGGESSAPIGSRDFTRVPRNASNAVSVLCYECLQRPCFEIGPLTQRQPEQQLHRWRGVVMRSALLASSLLLSLVSAVAQGKACKGVDFPEHIQLAGVDLTLNGLGLRKATFLRINVYVAALYVVRPSHDPSALLETHDPQEMILHFVRNVGAEDLRKAWREGFARVAPTQLGALDSRIATLNAWMSDVKAGERLQFIRQPRAGVQVVVDGITKGTIDGDDFSRAFVAIWLGAQPPNAELKSGLLGGECE
jgi:hypothetical protein